MSRDRTVGETFYIAFTTRAFATGIPTQLAGSPVISAYEDVGLTQITAGLTLGVDHDSVTGLNMITVVATGGNGFEAGKDYQLVITTGTVGGVSVVGEVVGQFSLGLSAAFTKIAAAIGTDGKALISTDAQDLSGTLDVNAKTATATALDLILKDSTFALAIADAIWDEVLTGGTHNVASSAGRRLRGIQDFQGYENGAVWIDTNNGVAGTTDYENGTVENPVDSIADALTIAASIGLVHLEVATGSSLTFAASMDGKTLNGRNWTLALGGQSCSDTVIIGATVSGICTGANKPRFERCVVNAVTLPPAIMLLCGLANTITVGSAGDFFLIDCISLIAGTSTPSFDFGAAVGNTNLNMRRYSGGIQLESMNDTGTDTASIEGFGQIVEGTCTGGAVAVRGNFTVSGITNITLSDNARIDLAQIEAGSNDALTWLGLDHLLKVAVIGTDVTDNSALAKLVSAAATADWDTYVNTTESMQALRDRGDAAWITGGGGGITDILNIYPLIPLSLDLANTATVRLGLMLINSLDDLPSTAEITPGTISIERKAIGGTSWSAVVTDAACSEIAGLIYYDEVFDSGSTYAEGDTLRITFKSQKITVAANDYEVIGATGRMFYTSIRQTMRGTDSAALASVCTEGRLAELDAANIPADIDAIPTTAMRGTDGANTTVPDAAGVAPTAVENRQEMDSNSTQLIAIKAVTDALTAAAAAKLATSAGTIVTGAAEAGTLSTTQMTTDLTEATDDHYNGRIIIWTSGVLQNQATDITDYSGATGLLTFTAVTEAPSAADSFLII
ncbi:MAG: hypothetical protein KAR06_01700 [Deltaproteobacteria bacterium]|nr:hypothetical protein [Deltaproteobacteria bacterium]